jgi:hypothetical protein
MPTKPTYIICVMSYCATLYHIVLCFRVVTCCASVLYRIVSCLDPVVLRIVSTLQNFGHDIIKA